jgi:small subunit ribosomal protein S18
MSEYVKKSSGSRDGGREYKSRDRDRDSDDRYNDRYGDDMDDMDDTGKKGRKMSNGTRKKPCRFMAGEEEISNLTYKNPRFLSNYMTEHGRIVPRRVTGNCAVIQRKLAQEIKRARTLALLGYVGLGPNAG